MSKEDALKEIREALTLAEQGLTTSEKLMFCMLVKQYELLDSMYVTLQDMQASLNGLLDNSTDEWNTRHNK